jgi:hypothetical protein
VEINGEDDGPLKQVMTSSQRRNCTSTYATTLGGSVEGYISIKGPGKAGKRDLIHGWDMGYAPQG